MQSLSSRLLKLLWYTLQKNSQHLPLRNAKGFACFQNSGKCCFSSHLQHSYSGQLITMWSGLQLQEGSPAQTWMCASSRGNFCSTGLLSQSCLPSNFHRMLLMDTLGNELACELVSSTGLFLTGCC